MRQVIIVSNRLPISVKKEDGQLSFSPSVGGLATGLSSYVTRRHNSWIGWPGIASEELNNEDKEIIVSELSKNNCTPVFLSQKQIDDFYNGYSNQVLWPLFHNLRRSELPPDKYQRFWQAYRQVNQKYAEAALNASETGGHIWVHDYQLMLVPEMIRAERPDVIIGFFLHIPWPASDKFFELTEAKRLLKGVIGADVAGFHTPSYVSNFLDGARLAGWDQASPNELVDGERNVKVDDFPMGIDYQKYATAGRSAPVKQAVKRYRKLYKKRKVIVSVDRLDPSKGLMERLRAYASLLDRYPKMRGKVVLSMVVAPSRMDVPAYKRLSKRLQLQVDEINSKFGKETGYPYIT